MSPSPAPEEIPCPLSDVHLRSEGRFIYLEFSRPLQVAKLSEGAALELLAKLSSQLRILRNNRNAREAIN